MTRAPGGTAKEAAYAQSINQISPGCTGHLSSAKINRNVAEAFLYGESSRDDRPPEEFAGRTWRKKAAFWHHIDLELSGGQQYRFSMSKQCRRRFPAPLHPIF